MRKQCIKKSGVISLKLQFFKKEILLIYHQVWPSFLSLWEGGRVGFEVPFVLFQSKVPNIQKCENVSKWFQNK